MKQGLQYLVDQAIKNEFGEEYIGKSGVILSHPPRPEIGDYASNAALVLARELKMSPGEVAERMVASIKQEGTSNLESNLQSPISNLQIMGGFINFTLNMREWSREVLEAIETQKEEYGNSLNGYPENIMVEYLSPNTNKPLHLGHLRNGCVGISAVRLLSAVGHNIIKSEIINDRGVHICKAMLAYQRWGEGKTPETENKKSDHFVGDWYTRFAQEAEKNEALQEQAQDMLRKWEAGTSDVWALWLKIRQWVLDGWSQTENILGFSFDKIYFESDVYTLGKDIIEQGLQKGLFRKNDKGNIVFDLPVGEFGLDEDGRPKVITVLRADGTSLYYTQDLGLQAKRVGEYHLDSVVHVVGSEQNFYFQALFAIFRALGYPWADKLYHLSYAMVYLPDGKMKSREGTVVDTDDLIMQMMDMAKQEMKSRNRYYESETGQSDERMNIGDAEFEHRAKSVALSAIKFYLLRHNPSTNIHYNPQESISFEGFTGPYCLYTYARAKSILRQVESQKMKVESLDYAGLSSLEERGLVRYLEEFPEVVKRAAREYNPALLATHIFELCQTFNTFYTRHKVLKTESDRLKIARLQLVAAIAQVIKNGLWLLGIETLEEM